MHEAAAVAVLDTTADFNNYSRIIVSFSLHAPGESLVTSEKMQNKKGQTVLLGQIYFFKCLFKAFFSTFVLLYIIIPLHELNTERF